MIEILFLISVCGYFIQSVIFIIGASKEFPKIDEKDFPTVSVVVAAKNEEKNILRCIKSLDALIYPKDKLEIIIVDDKSTDNTGKIVDEFISGKERFKKLVTDKEIGKLKGKANALAFAIRQANGDVIFTTDADCEVSPQWVYNMAQYYQDDVGIVNGYTTQVANSGFSGMQALDFIYLLIVAAGTINFSKPLSCIGNNMSYRKKAYLEVGGFEGLPFSVTEDSHLLQAIDTLKKYKIIYPLEKDSLVVSEACEDFKSIYRQKKRWGVGGLTLPFRGYIVAGWGFLSSLGILLTPVFYSPVWLYLAAFKIITDFFVLYNVNKRLGLLKDLKYFIHFQVYYTIYVLALPFVVSLSRKVIWKDKEY